MELQYIAKRNSDLYLKNVIQFLFALLMNIPISSTVYNL